MAVLFLDPLALLLLSGLLIYVWLVWRGSVSRWFGRGEAWTVLAWPIPLLTIGVPAIAGGLLYLAGQIGVAIGDGDVGDAVLYAVAYLAPAGVCVVWPPRWLLPAWTRRRLTPLVVEKSSEIPDGAMAAVQAARRHGSRARWVWRVDGLAGHVWRDGPALRFRSASGPAERFEIDEEMVAELRFADDGELPPHLAAPRGGWWSRGRLDIILDEVDRVRFRWVVPWRRDGLVTIEVAGRRPAQVWVADIRWIERILTNGGQGLEPGSEHGENRPA